MPSVDQTQKQTTVPHLHLHLLSDTLMPVFISSRLDLSTTAADTLYTWFADLLFILLNFIFFMLESKKLNYYERPLCKDFIIFHSFIGLVMPFGVVARKLQNGT